jgi:hypothetical protein
VPEWSAEHLVDEGLARRLIAGQCFEPHTLRPPHAWFMCAVPAVYGFDEGLASVTREALAGLERAT